MRKPATTETLSFTIARANLSQLVNRVQRGDSRIVIEKNGVPVAAIVSIEDADALRLADGSATGFEELMGRLSVGFSDVSDDEVEAMALQAVAEVRAERREQLRHTA